VHHKLAIGILILSLQGLGFAYSEPATKGSEPGNFPNAQQRIPAGFDLKVDVDSVFLNVSVRERETNRSLSGLQKSDFVVYEDGFSSRSISSCPLSLHSISCCCSMLAAAPDHT
jgi:hypothetical protein